VLGAFGEPTVPSDGAAALAAELRDLATWLELDSIEVSDRGDLAPMLRQELLS